MHKSKDLIRSDTGKAMFKCALAYLLGSMATFVPVFSNMFGHQDSKHLIATITVYFHPARSLGSMLDASICASVAFLYTTFVSIVSMSISVLFTDYLHQVAIGHAIILFLFVGGGLGFIGWVKLTRGDPLVNIACSLTSLSLITVLTKEGAVQEGNYSFYKILQILKMVIAGVFCTMLVSFLVFPSSGRLNLKKNMIDVTDSLSDMLGLITRSFISGDEQELEDHEYIATNDRYKKSSSKLLQNLKEAKYEHYFLGNERIVFLESKIAECLQLIGQSIGGLRSAAAMQFVISQEPLKKTDPRMMRRRKSSFTATPTPGSFRHRFTDLALNTLDTIMEGSPQNIGSPTTGDDMGADLTRRLSVEWRSPQQIFELFIEHLGPSMRSLAYTLKEILDDLPFDPENGYSVSNNPRFELSLQRALDMYKDARRDALKMVYDQKDMDRTRPVEVQADWEEAAACCGHFSFSLLEVADQIKEFLHCLDDLQVEVDDAPSSRSWSWLKFWQRSSRRSQQDYADNANHVSHDTAMRDVQNVKPESRKARDERFWAESRKAKWKQNLFSKTYNFLSFLRREDNKFGIKVGFGAMLYALPSYISATRPIYTKYRGEWGLLSYMLVCSMTIGASNTTGFQRFLGTGLGAALALLAWAISADSPIALSFFGFLMAYWTAYIIIGQGKGPMGRFIMLTYNLSALYSYSLLMADDLYDDDGDEEEDGSSYPLIFNIAGHRVVAVLSGVIWGLIITRLIWPNSARQKLKDGISLLWLRMGLIWARDPLTIFMETTDSPSPSYMNLSEENDMQRFLSKLYALVDASKHEFELRRPFPAATYDRILKSTGRMLESFHAMNVVIMKDLTPTKGELALLNATFRERRDLCARLSHQFSVLASDFKLEVSISTDDVLPNMERTRDRLLARVFSFRKENRPTSLLIDDVHDDRGQNGHVGNEARGNHDGDGDEEEGKATDEDYSLLYTYALVTGQLEMEIRSCLRDVEELFGVLDEESLLLQ